MCPLSVNGPGMLVLAIQKMHIYSIIFIELKSDPDSEPLMHWITGGPGCSSLSGVIYEIGNFIFHG
ncbi:hypothetical protein RDI58_022442 [Solanum bulbocastanum]|uniref:Uncharacterized protein n=1 Tax=Solanum bulbocastanum TaxID=147425 RepID=A0AAN8T243_SOLBU